jgi:hypothetical protein
MAKTPTTGNMLILTYVLNDNGATTASISSITQSGVTWTNATADTATAGADAEIWYGIVGSSPSTGITVNLSATPDSQSCAIADVYEFSGLVTSSPVDQTNNTGAAVQSSSGVTSTSAKTTLTEELWIGVVGAAGGATLTQSNPLNSFTLLDGASFNNGNSSCYASNGFLYYVASSEAQASSGTTIADSPYYQGCIATFFAASNVPVTYAQHWLW